MGLVAKSFHRGENGGVVDRMGRVGCAFFERCDKLISIEVRSADRCVTC